MTTADVSTPFEYAVTSQRSIGWIARDVALFLVAHWSEGVIQTGAEGLYVRKRGDSCMWGTVDCFLLKPTSQHAGDIPRIPPG